MSEYLMKRREAMFNNRPTDPVKKKKPIAKLCKKRQKLQRVYRKIIGEMADKDNECSVKSPVCSFFMSGANHKQKRSPDNLIKLENLERCCTPCQGYIENNTEWAKENGHLISRFS